MITAGGPMPWLLFILACTGGEPAPDAEAPGPRQGAPASASREPDRGVYGLRGVDWACAPCGDLSSLGGARVKVSTTLSPEERYGAAHLVDGDLDTAWCEGDRGDGTGSTLTLEFNRPVILEAIAVWGGYLKSDKTLRDNHRVKSVVARAGRSRMGWSLADAATPVATEPSTGAAVPASGWLDHVRASEPPWVGMDAMPKKPVRRVTLMVESIYPGTSANDLCISEIDVLGIDPSEL